MSRLPHMRRFVREVVIDWNRSINKRLELAWSVTPEFRMDNDEPTDEWYALVAKDPEILAFRLTVDLYARGDDCVRQDCYDCNS